MDKNKAPYEIEGSYMVTINGNETVITPVGFGDAVHFYKKNRDKSKSYKCHPDDKFDAGWVLNDYLSTCNRATIKAGDVVNIICRTDCYDLAQDTVLKIAKRNPQKHDRILLGWNKATIPPTEYENVRVIDVEPHPWNLNVLMCLVEVCEKYYLMGHEALEKVK